MAEASKESVILVHLPRSMSMSPRSQRNVIFCRYLCSNRTNFW